MRPTLDVRSVGVYCAFGILVSSVLQGRRTNGELERAVLFRPEALDDMFAEVLLLVQRRESGGSAPAPGDFVKPMAGFGLSWATTAEAVKKGRIKPTHELLIII